MREEREEREGEREDGREGEEGEEGGERGGERGEGINERGIQRHQLTLSFSWLFSLNVLGTSPPPLS